jgi:hypothetical protein
MRRTEVALEAICKETMGAEKKAQVSFADAFI